MSVSGELNTKFMSVNRPVMQHDTGEQYS